MMRRLFFALLVAIIQYAAPAAGSWSLSINEKDGLPLVSRGGMPAISSNFAFWAANWKWTELRTNVTTSGNFNYSSKGRNDVLQLNIASQVTKSADQVMTWDFDLEAERDQPDAIGGGIVFRFDLDHFSGAMGEPELLPAGQGWAWGRGNATRIEMRFEPPLPDVYFERGRKSEIRAIFYKGGIKTGKRRIRATVRVTGEVRIVPTISERFGPVAVADWRSDAIDWRTSPVDLSFLNAAEKPSGKHGFLKAVGDKLVFEDGTTARFWGTNLTAAALFGTSRENVRQQARRMSELGFNLVRLHHHDSYWVSPNIFGEKGKEHTQVLDPEMLDRLDWWIKCLKDEGIYVWLDLHVQRSLRAGDRIEGFDEIRKGKPEADLKGYNYINPSIKQAMQKFNENFLGHKNPHTGLRYPDDPSIAFLLITNENDLTHHFGNRFLPDKNVPWHNALYMKRAEEFAAKWGLPKNKTWRSWEPGPSKLFLNDLERQFHVDMVAHLRKIGVRVPIATTNYWGLDPLSSLPALAEGDLIDVHTYGGIGELERDPNFGPNLAHWPALAQVAGKPLSVSEWNVEAFPAPDRHVVPLYMASMAGMQGWDAMMQYAYSQIPLNGAGNPSNWHAYNDPALIAMLPAAALLYRQGHVPEASSVYVFAPTREQLFFQPTSPANARASRIAAEKGKLVTVLPATRELPWIKKAIPPNEAKQVDESNQFSASTEAAGLASDSGALRRNWGKGTFMVDTAHTQAAMGWLGGEDISLSSIRIRLSTRNASVAVQSLDGKPIGESVRLMISVAARAVLSAGGKMPFLVEPVEGELVIHAPKGLRLYQKLAGGGELRPMATVYRNNRYSIRLDRNLRSNWLFLR